MDTIYALASARGRAGIAVIRVSGPQAHEAALVLCGSLPARRVAGLRKLQSAGVVLDEALVLVFDAKASFTGEDVVELHVHGGGAIVRGVLGALSAMVGLRQSEPGEFTRRALENGRLDLAEVEGLADLIDAETEAQRRQAMRVFSGEMGAKVAQWRVELLQAMAMLDATIDFSDEDLPDDLVQEVVGHLVSVVEDLKVHIKGYGAAERLREGFEVALVGAPNVGKSTLLNALARREAALTSPIAGTTRDVIEVRMDIEGLPITILDTAGIRATDDALELAGISLTRNRAAGADLRIVMLSQPGDAPPCAVEVGDVIVLAKADQRLGGDHSLPRVSGLTGEGVDALLLAIRDFFADKVLDAGVVVHQRHFSSAQSALGLLEAAVVQLQDGLSAELCAEQMRLACRALESLIGKIETEELLGQIFSRFCIGK